jgi:cation:H+ antiporter
MFESLPLAANLAAFAVAAAAVWMAGTKLAGYADAIANETGLGQAVVGLALLGGITSLPEIAVAVTSSLAGHPALTINDVLGSAAINVLIIALADAVLGRDAITSVTASPRILLQASLTLGLLAMVAAATFAPDTALAGASVWSWSIALACGASLWVVGRSHPERAWQPVARDGEAKAEPAPQEGGGKLRPLVLKTAAAGAVVLVAGFVLAKTGEALAQQTRLGTSFVGVVLLAAATSLPEVSTVVGAVRRHRYEMALADVFGTNLFNVLILFLADLLYDGPPALREAGAFAGFAALLALVLTVVFLAGLIERRDRTFARMGFDSLAAIGIYAAGLVVLYRLR